MPGSIRSPVLIGRARELEILDGALEAAQNGAGRCVLLEGEAGIGKSRLAAEIRDRATADAFVILQGHCSEQDRSYPYAPWIDALRAFLASQSIEEVNGALGAFAPELVKLLPELSLLMPSIQPTPALDPAAEKHRLFESLTRFAASLAAAHPLLIVLEDLHWSDEPSLELLRFFVRRSATIPVLVLATYRTEDSFPRLAYHLLQLHREHLAEEIQLSPLTRPEVGRMAEAILHPERPINPGWLETLMLLTEGNPFFVEEITKSLLGAGGSPGEWDSLPIPRSIQQTVQSRTADLPDGIRRVLSLAAIIGERFDFALLRQIAAEDEGALLRMLKDLIAAQLIVEESADQFAFRHALTREAVYASLMLRERKAMHQTIGETLERAAGRKLDAPAAALAYHYYEAGEWQKAMGYAQHAGENAQALYAPREALTHFSHALDAAAQLGISMPLSALRGRAWARTLLGDFEGARADSEAVLALAQRGAGRVDEWHALIDLGFLWQSRDLERAGTYYQRALALARELGDASVVAPTLNRVGNWYFNRGRAREALPYHREALDLFRKLDDQRGVAHTMDLLGIVSYLLGEAIQGAAYLEQAVPILRELDDRQGLVNTLTNLAGRARSETEVLGETHYRQLAHLSDEALQVARSFSWYQGEALALIDGAICLEQTGDYGRALERLGRASSLAEESRDRESAARVQLVLGGIFNDLLALTRAARHLEAGLKLLQELGSGLLVPPATAQLAGVAVLQKDFKRARALLAPLLPAEYPEAEELSPQRRCWVVCAELELAQGNSGRGLEIVERLLAATPDLVRYGPHSVPRLSHLRSQALASLGRMEEAERELQGTLPVAQNQGRSPLVWRLHVDLGKVYHALGRRDEAEQEFASARTIIRDLANSTPEGGLRDDFQKSALATMPAARALTPRQVAKGEHGGLTAREREIAALIGHGRSNREIADELVIGENTTERHVANILSKLGFHSRTQIALWVAEKGLDK